MAITFGVGTAQGTTEGDRLDWDIDQIGSSTPGSDITVEVKVQLS
jgi:hypothetical protein